MPKGRLLAQHIQPLLDNPLLTDKELSVSQSFFKIYEGKVATTCWNHVVERRNILRDPSANATERSTKVQNLITDLKDKLEAFMPKPRGRRRKTHQAKVTASRSSQVPSKAAGKPSQSALYDQCRATVLALEVGLNSSLGSTEASALARLAHVRGQCLEWLEMCKLSDDKLEESLDICDKVLNLSKTLFKTVHKSIPYYERLLQYRRQEAAKISTARRNYATEKGRLQNNDANGNQLLDANYKAHFEELEKSRKDAQQVGAEVARASLAARRANQQSKTDASGNMRADTKAWRKMMGRQPGNSDTGL